jgi:hypothetical protein
MSQVHVDGPEGLGRSRHLPAREIPLQGGGVTSKSFGRHLRVWNEACGPYRSVAGLLMSVWDRVCPGMYLADRTGFHIAAKTVAAFDIAPLPGKDRPKPELVEYTDTAFRRVFPLRIYQGVSDRPCRLPVGFECHFVPRDTRSLELLKGLSLED